MPKMSAVIMGFNPELKDVPHMEEFLDKGLHIEFERAEMRNDQEWFVEHSNKYLPAMKAHRKYTSIFDWSKFDNWSNHTN